MDYRPRGDQGAAIDQMVLRTTSDDAQWHVIPANNKYFARIATLKAINKGLKRVLGET